MEELNNLLLPFENCKANSGIFSAPIIEDYKKCKVNLITLKGEFFYQIEMFTQKQAFHKNVNEKDIINELIKLFDNFSQFEFVADGFKYSLKITKKGKLLHNRKKCDNADITAVSHNKEKNYILKEGQIIPPLVDLGIFTHEGKIVKSMYDKYKQINRFVEIIDDCIKEKKPKSLNIIDFGCGKSYLTFIVYYYLTEIMKIDANIVGMDLKTDVINACNKTAEKYGYTNLHFIAGGYSLLHSRNAN